MIRILLTFGIVLNLILFHFQYEFEFIIYLNYKYFKLLYLHFRKLKLNILDYLISLLIFTVNHLEAGNLNIFFILFIFVFANSTELSAHLLIGFYLPKYQYFSLTI